MVAENLAPLEYLDFRGQNAFGAQAKLAFYAAAKSSETLLGVELFDTRELPQLAMALLANKAPTDPNLAPLYRNSVSRYARQSNLPRKKGMTTMDEEDSCSIGPSCTIS